MPKVTIWIKTVRLCKATCVDRETQLIAAAGLLPVWNDASITNRSSFNS